MIRRSRQERLTDYALDYFRGTLIFDRPVALADADGNPASIRVTFEVKDGQRQVSTNYALLDNARRRVEAARERVRIADVEIQNARDLPPELTFRQLRYLDELAAARSSESEQIARYNAALASYERSRGTLLRYNNIVLGETPDADLPRRLKTAMDLTADLPAR